MEASSTVEFSLGGEIGRRLEAVTEQWILPAPAANPGLLEMFRYRDRQPYTRMVPWAGEFAGKYLTHSVQIYRLTRNDRLRAHIERFVVELTALQAEDGYLGPWPAAWRLRKGAPNGAEPWDAWGHYHAMLGLLLWHETSGDERALRCACRIGDLLCTRFLGDTGETLHGTGCHEMNQAPIHSLAWLHRLTGGKRYLDLALQILREWETPPAGDYLREALAGKEFYQTPKPRWESLHPIMGLCELHRITGEETYRRAFEQIWWSIVKTDRHNNGGFSSGERAQGHPYHPGAIETCCTVAWTAMSVEMLRLTGGSVVADELELGLFNSGLGLISPSGRWVTYNTPMAGRKEASAHTIVFQARAGTPELNCCSVNGPRMLGMISDWAVMAEQDGVTVNYYGPGRMSVPMASGQKVTLVQETDYPRDSRVAIVVQPEQPGDFRLSLRIPYWSRNTKVSVNATPLEEVTSGRYLDVRRCWHAGDRVTVELDFSPHFWVHERRVPSAGWEADWHVFGAVDPASARGPYQWTEAMPGDDARTVPETLTVAGKTYPSVAARSEGGWLDFDKLFHIDSRCHVAYAYTEMESDRDTVLPVVFSAGEWVCWFVNGVKVYDNHATGGNEGEPVQRLHRLDLPLRKGRNLILARVTSILPGAWYEPRHWCLNVGKAEADPGVVFASIYRGPILLAYDPRFNGAGEAPGPLLAAGKLDLAATTWPQAPEPWLLLETPAADGREVRLCDFASAGTAGGPFYDTWLPVRFRTPPPAVSFSRANPLRSFRPPAE